MAFDTPLSFQGSNFKVKVSSGDTTGNYLENKLIAGTNITITKENVGANEDLKISASSGSLSPLTTKGDLYGHSTVDARIPVGANAQVLTADSTQALGLKWVDYPISVSNFDGTLTISPTTGDVVASINLSHANTWTGQQTFNTTAPVFNTMTAGSVFFAGTAGLLSQDNANLYWDDANNRLGIGTNTPTTKLEVVGGYITASGGITSPTLGTNCEQFGKNSSAASFYDVAVGYAANANDTSTAIGGQAHADTKSVAIGLNTFATLFSTAIGTSCQSTGAVGFVMGYNATTAFQGTYAMGINVATTAANQVVIGSSQPAYAPNDIYYGTGVTNATPNSITFHASGGSGTNIAGGNISFAGGIGTGNSAGGYVDFLTSDAGSSGTADQTLTSKMRVLASGKVGIGTTSPTAKVDILSTTEQLRLLYDSSNYLSTTVGSTGGVTFDAVGSGEGFTFSDNVAVPDEAYGSSWNGSTNVPTKNALYDKIETIASDVLFDHFADANNGTTVETDLYSDTLAAAQLSANGQKILYQAGGVFVGDATSTQRLKAYFGGTLIFDTGALSIGVTTTNWDLYITVIRVSASVVRCSATLTTSFASLNAYAQYTEVTGLTLANTQVMKITGTAAGVTGASNQITAKEGYIEFKPAA